jgi:hypothetical protein
LMLMWKMLNEPFEDMKLLGYDLSVIN